MSPARLLPVLAVAGAAVLIACGIGIRRDYSGIPVGQVGFEDLCGLQDYFDTIEAKQAAAPSIVNAVDIETDSGRRIRGGKNRFAFETDFQLANLRRVLVQNWSGLPEPVTTAQRLDIEVHWSEKAGVRRVVTDTAVELVAGEQSFALPYHVCLSELLYGEPLYRQRREMTGRSLPYHSLLGDGGLGPAPADAGQGPPNPNAAAHPYPSEATRPPPSPSAPAVPPPAPPTPAPAPAPATPASPPAPAPAPAPAPSPSAVPDGGPPAPVRPIFKSAPPAQ